MIDINNPLIKAYYDALNGSITNSNGDVVNIYEGEEPDNLEDPQYIVIGTVSDVDTSTKGNFNFDTTIIITINTWRFKYNNKKELNYIAGQILSIIRPTPASTLQATGINIISTSVDSNELDYGQLAGRRFVSRNLIFSHLISY